MIFKFSGVRCHSSSVLQFEAENAAKVFHGPKSQFILQKNFQTTKVNSLKFVTLWKEMMLLMFQLTNKWLHVTELHNKSCFFIYEV